MSADTDIPVSSIQVNPVMNTPTPPEGGKLLPCPFCGEKEDLTFVRMPGTVIHPHFHVQCENCLAQTYGTDRGRHIEQWNTRADQWQPAPDQHYALQELWDVSEDLLRWLDKEFPQGFELRDRLVTAGHNSADALSKARGES